MKHIIYQNDDGLQAFCIQGKKITERHYFQFNDEGKAKFVNYLSHQKKISIYWLIDTIQETYQTLSLPHVLGKDRRQLVKHKTKQLFGNIDYTYNVVQRRKKTGRRDDEILFTNIKDTSFIEPWLDIINHHKIPLIGVYSLPLVSEFLFKYLPAASHTLLVSYSYKSQSDNFYNLRQSFFIGKKLGFSRLIPLNIKNKQNIATEILKQINILQRYLYSTNLLNTSDSLLVVVLTDNDSSQLFKPWLEQQNTFKLHILVKHNLLVKIGLQNIVEKNIDLQHFVAFFLTKLWLVKNHYAKNRHYFIYARLRYVIYSFSSIILLSTIISGILFIKTTNVVTNEIEIINKKINQHRKKLVLLRKEVPEDLPLDIVYIRNIVDTGLYIQAKYMPPYFAWKKLSNVLDSHPNIQLERLETGIGYSKQEIFSSSRNTKSIESNNQVIDPLSTIDAKKNFVEGMRIYGKINMPNQQGYNQQILREFNSFTKHLRTVFWHIEILFNPYNKNTIMEGKVGLKDKINDNVAFTVEVFMQHEYTFR
ncbi:MAG: hypothetical protein KAH84_09225 [Thiomargarita sp.]|nr:hypothetical protein [Thiomargarita sp.]